MNLREIMPKLIVTDRSGNETLIDAVIGESVMQAIRNAGLDELEALCGGCRVCATCHVYVDVEWFDKLLPMMTEEVDLLQFSEYYRATSRLSCQVPVDESLDGIPIHIAPAD